MYHCAVHFYKLGTKDSFMEQIEKVLPLEHFTHVFTESEKLDRELAKAADIIFLNVQGMEEPQVQAVLEGVLDCKKADAELILMAEQAQVGASIDSHRKELTDIWYLPMSEQETDFRFRRWQENYKLQKDYWLVNNYLDTIINSVPHMIWYKDKDGAHIKVNECFCESVNKTMEQIQGRGHLYIWDLTEEAYSKGEFICMESEQEVMEKRKTCIFEENVKIKNEMRQLKTFKSPLFDLDGSVMGTVGVATDVTQERIYERMIIRNANTDFLTGLYNRRYISDYIEHEEDKPMVIYYIDLDNFKTVNDMYGHKEGDNALTLTADVMRRCMPEAMIARAGGDEFIIIETGEYTEEGVAEKKKWIEGELNAAFQAQENLSRVSASIGIAHSRKGKNVMDDLISEADKEMYKEKQSKKHGRSR
jgi:diguanylate cyclase (GGDEF)-like protein/PAS domain S-box-containing protein